MKKILFAAYVVATIIVITIALANKCAASEPETEPTENILFTSEADFEVWQFNQSQFLTRINNKTLVNEFLWLCDHSVYAVTVKNWNSFIRNYKAFQQAYKDYNRGFNVQFDDLLD